MKEVKTGSKHNVKMASDEQQENTATGLNSLSKQEKEKVDHILFLLDIFCVGDSSYHELSMFNDLPKSYLIKQRQTQLNDVSYYIHTWKSQGCGSFIPGISQGKSARFINQNPEFDIENESVKVKISVDGARMTCNTSFIILFLCCSKFNEQNGQKLMGKK